MSDINGKAVAWAICFIASVSFAYSGEPVAALLVWVYAGLRDIATALGADDE